MSSVSLLFGLAVAAAMAIGVTQAQSASCSSYTTSNSCNWATNCYWSTSSASCQTLNSGGYYSYSSSCGAGCIIGIVAGVFIFIAIISACCYRRRTVAVVTMYGANQPAYAYYTANQPSGYAVVPVAQPGYPQPYTTVTPAQPYVYGQTTGYTTVS